MWYDNVAKLMKERTTKDLAGLWAALRDLEEDLDLDVDLDWR